MTTINQSVISGNTITNSAHNVLSNQDTTDNNLINELIVDTTNDIVANDGLTSLREALANAVDGQTITFADSIANQTIVLSGGELIIDKSLTIDGEEQNIKISGNDASRVFTIDDGNNNNTSTVKIDSLTISDANSSDFGGAISNNRENITIVETTFSNNSASGGGSIFSDYGRLDISNSTFTDNSVTYNGGAIFGIATLINITNSTITNNSADEDGGAISSRAGSLNINNSTITSNTAVNDGGGIFAFVGFTEISSSIISGNTADNLGSEIYRYLGDITADANNLFGDSRNNNAQAFENFIVGASDFNLTRNGLDRSLNSIIDPNGLQDNGGKTQTIALVDDSLAINAGNNDQNLSNDQRGVGFDRVLNGQADIGAFESDKVQNLFIDGTNNNDTLTGGSGNDTLKGRRGDDTLQGLSGNDSLVGDRGNDSLIGGRGNDILIGGRDSDTLIGGNNDDFYFVDDEDDFLIEEVNRGDDTVSSTIAYQLRANFEDLILTGNRNLRGNGNSEDNLIIGNDGNNRNNGKEGNDTLIGGEGNDLLIGGEGDNVLVGGVGNDIYVSTNGLDVIIENFNEGIDTLRTNQSVTLQDNIENLFLIGSSTFNGNGNELDNLIRGNTANNELTGFDGNDSLLGNGGNDQLTGLEGDDSLFGGFGNDTLIGNSGNDTLIGGLGNDSFRFNLPDDGIDTIADFSDSDDTILIRGNGFGGNLSAGTLLANQFKLGVSATNANQRFIYDNNNGNLFFDSDGNGVNQQQLIAILEPDLDLTNQNISIV